MIGAIQRHENTTYPSFFVLAPHSWTGRHTCVLCKAHPAGDCKGAIAAGEDKRLPEWKCRDSSETESKGANTRRGESPGEDDEAGPSSSAGEGGR